MLPSNFHSVGDIDNLHNLCLQPRVQEIGLGEFGLEIGTTSEDEAGNVDLVVGDEMLNCQFSDFPHIVVTLFVSKTTETESGLTTSTVLLREIDSKLLDQFLCVTGKSTEELCAKYDELSIT